MNYITAIHFNFYRAFFEQKQRDEKGNLVPTLQLSAQQPNVLIYGENGSGKSSIFKGLEDFFMSSVTQKDFEQHFFSKGALDTATNIQNKTPYIKVKFQNGNEVAFSPEDDTTSTKNFDFIKTTNKAKGFLSYKDLLKVHLVNKEVNLFDLFVGNGGILATVQNEYVENAGEKKSRKSFDDLLKALQKKFDENVLKDFNKGLQDVLNQLQTSVNEMLKVFQQGFSIKEFRFLGVTRQQIKKSGIEGTITPIIELHGKEIPDFQHFLNEARLTALSICVYLAAVLKNPDRELKLLFLDDIFIGLDMSNRLPLLEILNEEFRDYQIFMTTYDRAWFEVAKQWFENKAKGTWKFFELYVDDFTNEFDVPVVLETKTHIEKAEYYLAKHDYPACGSYLRKACEEELERILHPQYYKVDVKQDEEGYFTKGKKLNALVTNLKEFCKDEGLDYTTFESLGIYKDAVLNPLSHNDIKNPIFKQELLAVMKVLKELGKISIKELPNTQSKTPILTFDNDKTVEIQIKEKILVLITQNGDKKLLSKCKVQLKNIRKNDKDDTSKNQEFASLQKLYEFLCVEFGVHCNLHELSEKLSFRGTTLQTLLTAL